MLITVGVMIAFLYDPSKAKPVKYAIFKFDGSDLLIADSSSGGDTFCTGTIELSPNIRVKDSKEM